MCEPPVRGEAAGGFCCFASALASSADGGSPAMLLGAIGSAVSVSVVICTGRLDFSAASAAATVRSAARGQCLREFRLVDLLCGVGGFAREVGAFVGLLPGFGLLALPLLRQRSSPASSRKPLRTARH